MSHDAKAESLSGTLEQLLFSPKGDIEGLLIKVGAKSVQISMHHATVDARALAGAVGKSIGFTALPDNSPKTKKGVHAVYKLDVITKMAGKAVKFNSDAPSISGVVANIHFAKHGEPNGVVLRSGEFIHTRPLGMKKLKLEVGSKVVAHGERRMTVLGTPVIEAREVNRVAIE
jgi:hypothetical protein